MPYRTTPFVNGEIYHTFNRSIAAQPILITNRDYKRMIDLVQFYRYLKPPIRFSYYQNFSSERKNALELDTYLCGVKILSFCLMPNHYHFLLKQLEKDGIRNFISNIQNSYSKYFNLKRKRSGSLFQSMFKAVHIASHEQLIHVSRYIHLNPVTAYIISPSQLASYPWSSYRDYFSGVNYGFVNTEIVLENFKTKDLYKKFVEDQIDYQRELGKIKHIILE